MEEVHNRLESSEELQRRAAEGTALLCKSVLLMSNNAEASKNLKTYLDEADKADARHRRKQAARDEAAAAGAAAKKQAKTPRSPTKKKEQSLAKKMMGVMGRPFAQARPSSLAEADESPQ